MLPLEQKYGDKIQFVIVDVNTPEGGDLAGQFSVNLIPAMFILDGKGNLIWSEVGLQSHNTLETYLKKAMAAKSS